MSKLEPFRNTNINKRKQHSVETGNMIKSEYRKKVNKLCNQLTLI